MPWLPAGKARTALGLTKGQLKRRKAAGGLETRKDPNHARNLLYWVPGDGRKQNQALTAEVAIPAGTADAPTPPCLKESGTGWINREGYSYDGDRRTYVLTVSTQRTPLVLRRERVEAIWSAYAGSGATIAEICREFELSRTLFQEIKSRLGLTKTRAPWPDEVIEETPEEDLVADALRAKESIETNAE